MLWRTTLLIALVLVLTQVGTLLMFQNLRRDANPRELALRAAALVEKIHAEALGAEPQSLAKALARIADDEDVRIYLRSDRHPPEGRWQRPFLRNFSAQIRGLLGPDTPVAFQPGQGGFLWIGFSLQQQAYWLVLPRINRSGDNSADWIGWVLGLLLVALLAAYLIVAHVSRPLKQLAVAATKIGAGESVAPVPESGPEETRALARSFNRMATSLKALETDRGVLLAGVSHDLRTPLARLRLGLELMPESDLKLKAEMERDIELMNAIVGQFLAYVRGEDNEKLQAQGDLNALISEVASGYVGESITVRCHAIPLLPVRPLAIKRLLANLIDNALKHAASPIEVISEINQGQAWIRVLDRGPGIPEAELQQALQPFSRLDVSRSAQGTGLGLAIAARIAKLHGGQVSLHNRPGGGLEARLAIPLPR